MNYWHGKKVLITGGAGLIGSFMAEELVNFGSRVTVVDNLKRGNLRNLDAIIKNVEFIHCDLTDFTACLGVCKGMDTVLHLASDAYGLSYSYKHHSEILTHNILLNTNVLKACHCNDVSRILAVSSSCVYPDDSEIPTEECPYFV